MDRLPNWGIVANGELYEAAAPSELPIEERVGFVLPTPSANDAKNNPSTPSQWDRHDSLSVEVAKIEGNTKETIGSDARLHPHFVEWMMGFPIGWTDLEP